MSTMKKKKTETISDEMDALITVATVWNKEQVIVAIHNKEKGSVTEKTITFHTDDAMYVTYAYVGGCIRVLGQHFKMGHVGIVGDYTVIAPFHLADTPLLFLASHSFQFKHDAMTCMLLVKWLAAEMKGLFNVVVLMQGELENEAGS